MCGCVPVLVCATGVLGDCARPASSHVCATPDTDARSSWHCGRAVAGGVSRWSCGRVDQPCRCSNINVLLANYADPAPAPAPAPPGPADTTAGLDEPETPPLAAAAAGAVTDSVRFLCSASAAATASSLGSSRWMVWYNNAFSSTNCSSAVDSRQRQPPRHEIDGNERAMVRGSKTCKVATVLHRSFWNACHTVATDISMWKAGYAVGGKQGRRTRRTTTQARYSHETLRDNRGC